MYIITNYHFWDLHVHVGDVYILDIRFRKKTIRLHVYKMYIVFCLLTVVAFYVMFKHTCISTIFYCYSNIYIYITLFLSHDLQNETRWYDCNGDKQHTYVLDFVSIITTVFISYSYFFSPIYTVYKDMPRCTAIVVLK